MAATRWAIPASFFGMVLGLAGLGNDWRVAARLWRLPGWIGEAVMAVAAAVWLVLVLLYAMKWVRHADEARAEIAHPVQCCFAVLVPVTTMLVGIAALPHSRPLAEGLCAVGMAGTVAFGVWRHGGLWRGGRPVGTTTPVLYLPTVAANLVSAIAANALGWVGMGQVFFGAGVIAWLALESVILGRMLHGEEMPVPMRPTLGIQQAPAAVALLAYAGVSGGTPDLVAHMLLGYALLQSLILLRLWPWLRQRFTPGYWAFTFGTTALASGTMRFAERAGEGVFATLALPAFVIANLLVIGLALATALSAIQGRLLPPSPAAVPPVTPAT